MTALQHTQASKPIAISDLPKAETRLTDLLTDWRAVPMGKTLGEVMAPEQRQLALLISDRLLTVGMPEQVSEIVGRLWGAFPQTKAEQSASRAEDYVRIVADQPLLAIWQAYEQIIREPREFCPSPGVFLQAVTAKAGLIRSVRNALEVLS